MTENPKNVSLIERFFRWVEKIVRAVFGFFFKLVHVELSEKQWAAFLQFVRFAIIGLFNTALSLGFNIATLVVAEKAGWDGTIGSLGGFDRHLGTLIGFLASCVNSYVFNSRYTFGDGAKKTASQHARAFLKVVVSYSFAGLFLGWALNFLWLNLGVHRVVGALLNVIISVPINFLLNKFWAYKK